MKVLVIGGSGSGKSAFAEKKTDEICGANPKYYIATMRVYDAEGARKAAEHRKKREGKNYITIEQPDDLGGLTGFEANSCALLESVSNLVANEMFRDGKYMNGTMITEKVSSDIDSLSKKVRNLVVVTDNVFEDGCRYGDETIDYINVMGRINMYLADMSDEVWEVVCGIPLRIR